MMIGFGTIISLRISTFPDKIYFICFAVGRISGSFYSIWETSFLNTSFSILFNSADEGKSGL